MKSIGEKVSIKTIDELKDEGFVDHVKDGHIIILNPVKWDLTSSEPYLGKEGMKIISVDTSDPAVPYQIEGGYWIPEFMAKEYVEQEVATTAPTVAPASGERVKYGKIFKFLIKLEKEMTNTHVIKDANVNRISKLPMDVLHYVEHILEMKYPEYNTHQGSNDSMNIASSIFSLVNSKLE